MDKICDLHTHSVFSDGTCTPAEILDKAADIGLSAVALCDHNTVDGLPDFLLAAAVRSIDAIPGAEFSVDYEGRELHLLGLFIPEACFSQVSHKMLEVNARKEQSNVELIRALNGCGISIDYDEIKKTTPNGQINRAHIAAALTRMGYTESIPHAFETYLSSSQGYYKEPQRLTVWEMLDFISSIGAVSVLAHPFLNLTKDELYKFLPMAKRQGLVGMECAYSSYDEATCRIAFEMAREFDLAFSGGSDFHGSNKPDVKLGVGKGNLCVPYDWYLSLKEKSIGSR